MDSILEYLKQLEQERLDELKFIRRMIQEREAPPPVNQSNAIAKPTPAKPYGDVKGKGVNQRKKEHADKVRMQIQTVLADGSHMKPAEINSAIERTFGEKHESQYLISFLSRRFREGSLLKDQEGKFYISD